ncbi:hypothetical protein BS47DRAFT_30936 [Hydnum rufescens UP504]|uniref:Secreted protein n=1 Tax=Hydnum rufescens UP504 TaxID=1448309 RepID=A0A9P6DZC9_9AGAM|nr:hypothetical protein BS47DRAFT_30936 [Hydnum rufescens UP504]
MYKSTTPIYQSYLFLLLSAIASPSNLSNSCASLGTLYTVKKDTSVLLQSRPGYWTFNATMTGPRIPSWIAQAVALTSR